MKIGLSFGKCIRDLVLGTVDPADVLVIVTSTDIKTRDELPRMVELYNHDPSRFLGLDEARCLDICYLMWDAGKIFQPRNFTGGWTSHFSGDWVEMVPSSGTATPGVKDAWDAYRMLLTLSGDLTEKRER